MEQINAKLRTSDKEALSECALFKGIEDKDLHSLLKEEGICFKKYLKGDLLLDGSIRSKELFIIVRGTASVYKHVSAQKTVLMSKLKKSDIFGMATLFSENAFPTSVVSDGELLALVISKTVVERWFSSKNELIKNYIGILSDKIQFLNRRIESFAAYENKDKLYNYLKSIAPKGGGAFALPCPVKELSELLGMGRTSLYRSMEILEEEKKLTKTGKLFLLN